MLVFVLVFFFGDTIWNQKQLRNAPKKGFRKMITKPYEAIPTGLVPFTNFLLNLELSTQNLPI